MEKKFKTGIFSFKYALKGIAGVLRTEPNARLHVIIASLVVILGSIFGISRMEWLILILCIGMVILAEIFNTAVERLVDIVSPQVSKKAGAVKDMAAGAVFIAAITSVIAGLVIFVPYLTDSFKRL